MEIDFNLGAIQIVRLGVGVVEQGQNGVSITAVRLSIFISLPYFSEKTGFWLEACLLDGAGKGTRTLKLARRNLNPVCLPISSYPHIQFLWATEPENLHQGDST